MIAQRALVEKVTKVLSGRNVCFFIYGDISEQHICPLLYGKTDSNCGILKASVEKLFQTIGSDDMLANQIKISVTAVECLNNKFRDLLQPPSEVPVSHELHRDGEGNVWVSNIVGVEVKCADDFLRVADICRGRQSLMSSKGKYIIPFRESEAYLSRGCIVHPDAHVVLTAQLDIDNQSVPGGSNVLSRLTFVHLAPGSAVATQATLTGVGDVLENLAAGNSFIPYRHAKLTRMLEPSLPRGNVDIGMILSVSTSSEDVIETNRSLLFGRKLNEIRPAN